MQIKSLLLLSLAMIQLGAATPPALANSCFFGPYILFFDAGSSAIKKEALGILQIAVENEGLCGAEPILVGFSDPNENSKIARKRIVAVKNYLESRGVFVMPDNMRTLTATMPRVMTPPRTVEQQNRRVELIYGTGKR